jgi:hypothetical protein
MAWVINRYLFLNLRMFKPRFRIRLWILNLILSAPNFAHEYLNRDQLRIFRASNLRRGHYEYVNLFGDLNILIGRGTKRWRSKVRKSWKAGFLYGKNIICWQTDRHDDYYRALHLRCGALIIITCLSLKIWFIWLYRNRLVFTS